MNYSYNSLSLFGRKNRTNKPTRCFTVRSRVGRVCRMRLKKKKGIIWTPRPQRIHERTSVRNPLIHIALKRATRSAKHASDVLRWCVQFWYIAKSRLRPVCVKHRHDNGESSKLTSGFAARCDAKISFHKNMDAHAYVCHVKFSAPRCSSHA